MNSIKCPECGFVSFATADKCKRCGFIFKKVTKSLELEHSNGLPIIEIKPVGLISRLFSKNDKETAYQEIQNLLATTYIPHISPLVINSILNKYKISSDEARTHFRDWFLKILKHLANDLKITDEEYLEIQHLQTLFNFSDQEVKDLQTGIIYPIYESAVREAFQKSPISSRIKDNCSEIAVKLRIDQQSADRIFLNFARPFYSRIFKEATVHRKLSPKKENELIELAKNLNISLDEVSKNNLKLFRSFWKLSQGDLPVVDMPISYYENELCAASISANRFEIRKNSVEYVGFKSAELIVNYLRSQSSHSSKNDLANGTMTFLDSGTLYFTSHRILFKGTNKTVYAPLEKIKKYSFFYDGLVIEKNDGTHHIYRIKDNNGYLSAVMEGLLSNKAYEDYKKGEFNKKYSNQKTNKEETKSKSKQPPSRVPPNHLAAYYKTLNIEIGATSEEIKRAYKQQAMKYHPDKVAHLAPEFRELAETKMKELNIARQYLQGQ